MTKTNNKPQYDETYFEDGKNSYVNDDPTYLPSHYAHRGYTDTFYNEEEEAGVGSFLFGALVGGVIGAATALFLAPKTGKEMRSDFSTQANQIKDKSIELSGIAKDKATQYGSVAKEKATEYGAIAKDKASEFASTAKEKTDEVTKTIQQQSGQIVDKVKSYKKDATIPMDDGTASSEGEEAIDFVDKVETKVKDILETAEETTTQTAEAIKDAVAKDNSDN